MAPDLSFPPSREDRYPVYHRLQEQDPIHWSPKLNAWVITRFEDVEHILGSPARFSVERYRGVGAEFLRRRPDMEDVATLLREWAVYRDAPAHTRLRGFLNHSFLRRQIETMQPRIQALIDELLAKVTHGKAVDFLEEFAIPLPVNVIGSMLGVPAEDMGPLKGWSNQIAAYIGSGRGDDNVETAKQGLFSTADYFRALVRERRERPTEDLLGLLLMASDERGPLGEDEVVSNCVLILFAGHETTTNVIASGLFHLLKNPAELALLRAQPELIPTAVEEFLRYEPPVSGTLRVATEDVELSGKLIRRGDVLAVMIAAANRDPKHFARPDALDVTRSPNRHLSFGYGVHYCLGAPLGRLEAQIAFSTLLRRFGHIAIVGEPSWKEQLLFHGLERLEVTLLE